MYLTVIVLIYVIISYLIFKQLAYISKFRKNNITNAGVSRNLSSLATNSSFLFKQLVSKGVIQEVKGGKYFLDAEKGTFFAKKRRGLFYSVTFFFLIIFFFVWNNF
ncbi:MAG: hypothetical protein GXO74_16250 [Calditrichaeota bacterium]|nr:hypothetical protein [Calditrichota bacterium]